MELGVEILEATCRTQGEGAECDLVERSCGASMSTCCCTDELDRIAVGLLGN